MPAPASTAIGAELPSAAGPPCPRRGDRRARSAPSGVPGDGAIRGGEGREGQPPPHEYGRGGAPPPSDVEEPGKKPTLPTNSPPAIKSKVYQQAPAARSELQN